MKHLPHKMIRNPHPTNGIRATMEATIMEDIDKSMSKDKPIRKNDTETSYNLENNLAKNLENNLENNSNYHPLTKNQIELHKQIIDVKQELNHRRERLQNNIFAGVNYKAILAQRHTIFDLELKYQHLDHKYKYDLK